LLAAGFARPVKAPYRPGAVAAELGSFRYLCFVNDASYGFGIPRQSHLKGDIRLSRQLNGQATELQGDPSDLERPLQTLIEENLGVLLASLEDYVFSLGDDVQRKELKLSIAFNRLKNFATVVPQKGRLLLYLHLDVDRLPPPPGIGRDVRHQGHWGTGGMELSLATAAQLDVAKPLIQMAYEGRGSVLAA